jgi:pyruvate,water dikinase
MPLKDLLRQFTQQVIDPGRFLRDKYDAFKTLLKYDKRAHEDMAELEDIYHNQTRVDLAGIEEKYHQLADSVIHILNALTAMAPSRYPELKKYYRKLDFYIRLMLTPNVPDHPAAFAMPLGRMSKKAQARVGGKAFQLCEASKVLRLASPKGFVITTDAFFYLLKQNGLKQKIHHRLAGLDINSTRMLSDTADELQQLIMTARISPEMKQAIYDAFDHLEQKSAQPLHVAMRSSAVGEDTQTSFAGQYQTVLHVSRDRLIEAYKQVVASKYSSEAIYYRINYGLADMETPMAVLVFPMVDAKVSGVMYTAEPEASANDILSIHAVLGIGELLVSGQASPDIYLVSKEAPFSIQSRTIGAKKQQLMHDASGEAQIISTSKPHRRAPALTDDQILTLARWGHLLEKHYGMPQDIEWCMDQHQDLHLLQCRRLQTEVLAPEALTCSVAEISQTPLLQGGHKASSGIGAGPVFKIDSLAELDGMPHGVVLVAKNASPQYVKVMGKLNAVLTDTGSKAGHLASVAREFGIPMLVDTGRATALLKNGQDITVYADEQVVYDGMVSALLESSCARPDLLADSPFTRRMKYIMSFVSPLNLVDPEAEHFTPESCRSMHDIIRFAHEKAMQDMFSIGEMRAGRMRGAKKLVSDLPMLFYILDIGGGLSSSPGANPKEVKIHDIVSVPMQAVWQGLNHPNIHWSGFTHFNWAEFDDIAMSGGMISKNSKLLASYAVISQDYLNLNLRFGYHFVIIDTLCSAKTDENYVAFRFSGGGGDLSGRILRANFLKGILKRLDFEVETKSDLVDGQRKEVGLASLQKTLDMLGRLLGATRLMDMYLKQDSDVEALVEEFMQGRYHFASVED